MKVFEMLNPAHVVLKDIKELGPTREFLSRTK
jgi:hypothetical protein